MWYYMSFADASGFLGACILEADNEFDMMTKSHATGLNRGGEVAFLEIPDGAIQTLPDKFKNCVLLKDDIEEMDRVMANA